MGTSTTEPMEDAKPELHELKQSTTWSEDRGRNDIAVLDKSAEKRLLRKLDLQIIPILWLIFMLAFLDRTNVNKNPA